MIYAPSRFLFIHQPRTSGVSFTQSVASDVNNFRDGYICLSHYPSVLRRHARACELVQVLPTWDGIFKFSIVRNPWEVVESTYAFFRRASTAKEASYALPQALMETQRAAVMDFASFTVQHFSYLQAGQGHWHHWCAMPDGRQLGVTPVLYEEVSGNWDWLCGMCQISCVRDRQNEARSGAGDVFHWTHELDAFVCSRFADDISRFCFARPDSVVRKLDAAQ